jgi:hypothetical protein
MNKHTVDTITTAALRDLDPAPTTALTDAELERADATFARILATPHHDQAPEESDRPRRRRRLVLAGLVGAAGAAVPALLLGGGSAFASWTPKPEPLTAAAATEAATTCRAALQVPDQGERVVIAERRGGWTYVLITGPEAEGACLMPDDLVGHQDPADHREEGFFGTYDTDPVEAPTPARDRIVETESMAGSVPTPGHWPFRNDEGWFSWVEGYVGSDVTGVTVHTPVGTDVEASVANGRFAAWWPSDQPSSENLEVMGAWTYTVSLADGSTRRVTG